MQLRDPRTELPTATEPPFESSVALNLEAPNAESLIEALYTEGDSMRDRLWGMSKRDDATMAAFVHSEVSRRDSLRKRWLGKVGVSVEDIGIAWEKDDIHEILKNAMVESYLDDDSEGEEPFLHHRARC